MDKPIFRGFYIMYLTNNMGIKKQIKNRLQQFYTSLIAHYEYHLYKKQSKNYLSINGYPNIKLEGEDEYVKKWDSLSKKIEVYSYRFYSNYMGLNPNIVPEDILHSYIETKLNPRKYLQSYTDKNIFQQIIENKYLPVTLLCRMNGSNILDSDYQVFDFTEDITVKFRNVSSVILKPSVDTSSGKGVIKFTRKNKHFVNKDGIVLNKELLLNYGDDFILQECILQSDFMSNLCRTSVNTIRVAIYRSVKDESINILAAILRIGKDGAVVDNAHAGGRFIGINIEDGKLDKKTLDQFGTKLNIWNNINYSTNQFYIPNWNKVILLAKYVGKCLHHQRLINLDIALNKKNEPILIEYNIKTMSPWLFMLTNQVPLGNFTDEIIHYCRANRI